MGIIILAAFLFSCQQATTTVLSMGSGSGLPSSENNIVEISLKNTAQTVKGIQTDICDTGNYLTGVSCEAMGSAAEYSCVCNELSNGCLRVLLFSTTGNIIEEGTGPIISISYNVSVDAPPGQCTDLIPEQVLVSDENNNRLPSATVKGTFCF